MKDSPADQAPELGGKERKIPVYELSGQTLIYEEKAEFHGQLFRINGVVVLPFGAEIELPDSPLNATVVRVRLLAAAGGAPASVCIGVKIKRGARGTRGGARVAGRKRARR